MHSTNCGSARSQSPRRKAGALVMLCALLGAGSIKMCLAASSSQTAFASPDEASRALVSAVQADDERTMATILGGGSALIRSDDKAEDALDRQRFVQKYQEMHRWSRQPDGIAILYIGSENWPFPIPLVTDNGMWRFDSKAGSDEVLFRRIGENEVTAIVMCDTLVKAKTQPGRDSEADRLVETMLPAAGDAEPNLLHGYYFHVLSNPGGGFSAIAYPAVYRTSGVMTFMVTQDGRASEKDLGPDAAKIAASMTAYQTDATWKPVESAP
jgi:Protein of unknown function (DUF2950)